MSKICGIIGISKFNRVHTEPGKPGKEVVFEILPGKHLEFFLIETSVF